MTESRPIALVTTLALVLLVGASEPAPAQQKKDAQSTFEPASGPGVGHKFLEKMVGDWDVVKSFYPRTGEPNRTSGECRQTMIHEGRFLRSEFVFRTPDGKTSTGTGTIGFEPASGIFTSFWIDSRQTPMSVRQSRDKFNGEEIVLFSKSLAPDGKETRRSRTVTRFEDGGRKLVHRQYNPGPDGQERVLMELMLTRKADAASSGK